MTTSLEITIQVRYDYSPDGAKVLTLATFTYDADGNLASDSRKGISVAYNVLGLPRTVTSGTTVLSHYEYLPDGSKLSSLAGSGAGYKYRGSFVYSVDALGNEKLESVACDEGRISVTYSGSGTASYRDDWHVRDYLGNTRLVVNITSASTPPSTGILEKSDYLPFGTRVATSSTPLNRWRQSGKEEQVIGGNDLGVLDFGARHYDPWLARWTTQDPMAGKYTSLSPYAYCSDNPVFLVDQDGKKPRIYVQKRGLGHAFITTGEGRETIVYTYGRYGSVYGISSGITSGNLTPVGEGVLGVLKGKNAASFLSEVLKEGDYDIFVLSEGSDERINNYISTMIDGTEGPSNPNKRTFNNEAFHVVDTYSLLDNNCVSFTKRAAKVGGVDVDSPSIKPSRFAKKLSEQSDDKSIIQMEYPQATIYYILSMFQNDNN